MTMDVYPLLVAGLIGLGTLFLCLILADLASAGTDRVAGSMDENEAEQSARLLKAIGGAFRGIAAPFGDLTARLDQTLTYAGRPYGGIRGQEYLAAVVVLGVLIAGAIGLFFGFNRLMAGASPADALGAALRWLLIMAPAVWIYFYHDIQSLAAQNSDDIEREFPFFLDLAILVVQAGGTPRKALSKYVEAAPGTPLSREIAITARDADATSFEDALYRMIDRVQPASVKTILKNLAQGERTSGEVEQFYTDQAEELRFLREEMANRTAERLRTNIVFPVFLLMSAVILAALAPTIVSIRGQGFF
ncbi:MAG: type II secretion system F family protein [Pseudomonadota bacterium]